MLVIRLTRRGKKNQPFFRIVVIDKRKSSKGGRAVEVLGYVNPLTKKNNLKKERVQYWLSKGAKPSATIHNLLVQEKVIEGKKIHVSRIKKSKLAEMVVAKAAATPAPASVAEEKPVEVTKEEKPAEAPKEEKPQEPITSAEPTPELPKE